MSPSRWCDSAEDELSWMAFLTASSAAFNSPCRRRAAAWSRIGWTGSGWERADATRGTIAKERLVNRKNRTTTHSNRQEANRSIFPPHIAREGTITAAGNEINRLETVTDIS